MLSIASPHFFNWASQLKDSGHDVYWLDILDSDSRNEQLDFAHQITGWRYRLKFPGRYYVKLRFPTINKIINVFNERSFADFFKYVIKNVQPDVVHSFTMHLGCLPILQVMLRFPNTKWIYSSWGSDLFFYKNDPQLKADIKKVLKRIDYMFSDCHRDFKTAKDLGFKGQSLGVFPGRGGFDFEKVGSYYTPLEERKLILIKGYQGKHGRCLTVIKALEKIYPDLLGYEIVLFGVNKEIRSFLEASFIKQRGRYKLLGNISHKEVMKLMGKATIYIGNSRSDGIPNTLLEAIVMGAYPIQSNPGNATSELIFHGYNGHLINDCEDSEEIKNHILEAIKNKNKLKKAVMFNLTTIKPQLERTMIERQVLTSYSLVKNHL